MATYVALLRKDDKSDFGVEFPDFPGCVTAGETLEEAQRLAREALELHLDGMVEDGEDIPAPSSVDAIMAVPANRGAMVFLVEVETELKSVRVNVTFSRDVLEKIDREARRSHDTRSGFLAKAALRAMNIPVRHKAAAKRYAAKSGKASRRRKTSRP